MGCGASKIGDNKVGESEAYNVDNPKSEAYDVDNPKTWKTEDWLSAEQELARWHEDHAAREEAEMAASAHVAELLQGDAALDPATPLVATHFHGQGRLAVLLLPRPDGGTADIRLLSARKLVKYIDGGGRMAIRQKLEAERPDLFVDAATVRKLLPELETKDDGNTPRCTFSSVVALSYACKPRPTARQPPPCEAASECMRTARCRGDAGGPRPGARAAAAAPAGARLVDL